MSKYFFSKYHILFLSKIEIDKYWVYIIKQHRRRPEKQWWSSKNTSCLMYTYVVHINNTILYPSRQAISVLAIYPPHPPSFQKSNQIVQVAWRDALTDTHSNGRSHVRNSTGKRILKVFFKNKQQNKQQQQNKQRNKQQQQQQQQHQQTSRCLDYNRSYPIQ